MAEQSGMRIWHQSMTELDKLGAYRIALEEHARAVTSPGTEVVVQGIPSGAYGEIAPSDLLLSPYPYHLLLNQVIEFAYQAERQGYDAFVLGSFSEPYLREIRSILDIPVVSIAESSFLVGCSIGKYLGLISNSPDIARIVKGLVEKHHLQDRVSGVHAIDPPLNEPALAAAFMNPAAFLADFRRIAERVIEDGADAIIPAEGVLNELLVANGVQRIGEAAVLDSIGVTWNYAEMMVNLRRRTGLTVGRRWEYARPGPAVIEHVRRWVGLEK